MGAFFVELSQPLIDVRLKRLKALVDLLAEGHAIEFVEDGLVKAFADAVGLRASYLGLGVLHVFNGQIQLVLMMLRLATILGPTVSENAKQLYSMLFVQRQHTVV